MVDHRADRGLIMLMMADHAWLLMPDHGLYQRSSLIKPIVADHGRSCLIIDQKSLIMADHC